MSDRYPPEFRAQVVALYRDDVSAKQLAEQFGISPTSVTNWARRARLARGVDPPQEALSDKEEIARLKRLVKQREEELDTLGKALALFVTARIYSQEGFEAIVADGGEAVLLRLGASS